MSATLAPTRCLRSSMQNMGGSAGLSRSQLRQLNAGRIGTGIEQQPTDFPAAAKSPGPGQAAGPCRSAVPTAWAAAPASTACRQTASNGMGHPPPSSMQNSSLIRSYRPLQIQPAQQRLQRRGLAVLSPAGVARHRVDLGVAPPPENRPAPPPSKAAGSAWPFPPGIPRTPGGWWPGGVPCPWPSRERTAMSRTRISNTASPIWARPMELMARI